MKVNQKDKMIKRKNELNFIDLFAGVGGFHIAMHSIGGKCVFASEWDKSARETYTANYYNQNKQLFDSGNFAGDINLVNPKTIPDFNILCAGFPCQPFSHAGLKKGFEDTRGTLFFNVAEIVKLKTDMGKQPDILVFENVKGLKNHDKGETLKTILRVIDELGYDFKYDILNTKYFGLPQNRERIYIVAWKKNKKKDFQFPLGIYKNNRVIFNREDLTKAKPTVLKDILVEDPSPKFTISDNMYRGHINRKLKHQEKGNGFGFSMVKESTIYTSTISARYWKDGSEILIEQPGSNPRRLTPREAFNLQGYPHNFKLHQSEKQCLMQAGNSVSIPVVKTLAKEILKQLL